MKIIYAPWREKYIKEKLKHSSIENSTSCPFCTQIAKKDDEQHLIIKRYTHVFVCINKYPYNPGHLLIIPFEHQSELDHLPAETAQEIMIATQKSISVLKKILEPSAFNIGMNMGKDSGGSIPEHLHMHILPRFHGDSNFLSSISDTKLISIDLIKLYATIKALF